MVFDNTKLKKAVPEFKPTVHFEEGIAATIRNVLSNRELQKDAPEFDSWCDRVISVLENARKEFQS